MKNFYKSVGTTFLGGLLIVVPLLPICFAGAQGHAIGSGFGAFIRQVAPGMASR
jgi:hypothetical protein